MHVAYSVQLSSIAGGAVCTCAQGIAPWGRPFATLFAQSQGRRFVNDASEVFVDSGVCGHASKSTLQGNEKRRVKKKRKVTRVPPGN